jgi:hypothetical protein
MMRSKGLILIALVTVLATVSYANFDWGAYWYFYESDGSTWLENDADNSVGAFVQLIHDVDGDGLDTPVNTGTGISGTSDDTIYWATWFGDNGGGDGAFTGISSPVDVTAGASEDGDIFYARVWSAPSTSWDDLNSTIDGSANYWDGLGYTYSDGSPSTYNMTGPSGSPYSANITVDGTPVAVPEPTVVALAALGLLLIRGFRRNK